MKTLTLLVLIAFISCTSSHKVSKIDNEKSNVFVPQYTPGPRALIYKTKKDYSNLVPVLLSDDRTEIVSYPHPSDLKAGNEYPVPTFLNKGYLLDNRGIGINVAFLHLTFNEYSELKEVPTLKELYSYIIDNDPLIELCDCGNKTAFTNIEKQLNDIIDDKKLRTICKKVK